MTHLGLYDSSHPLRSKGNDLRAIERLTLQYMSGARSMDVQELCDAKKAAEDDPELKGRLRASVLARFDVLIEHRKMVDYIAP
jgi:hypothetical protein